MDLYGTTGNDTLIGGADDDNIYGDAGDDVIQGGAGDDFLWGDAGNDFIDTGEGDYDYASGGAGNDTLIGHGANDALSGGDGNDSLTGAGGNDYLWGDAGHDRLEGGADDDYFDAGAGNDTLDGGSSQYYDYAYFHTGAITGASINLALGTAQDGQGGTDTLISIEWVWATDFSDTVIGDASDNYLSGAQGNDYLEGGAGNDFLFGDVGDDTLVGGLGDDFLMGGDGFDVAVFSGNFADYSFTATGYPGYFFLEGLEGLDGLFEVELLQFADRTVDVNEGTAVSDTLVGGDDDDVFRGLEGDDTIQGGGGSDALFGDEGNDRLEGGTGNDLLDGGTGTDTLAGGTGNDTYVVDVLTDEIIEYEQQSLARTPGGPLADDIGGGIDKVVASLNYTLGNFLENLTLADGAGALTGIGNALANVIAGNESNNHLAGQAGDDQIDGGAGFDTAVYAGTRSQYSMTLGVTPQVNGSAMGEGTDTLTSVERLQFSDTRLAIDIEGNAGSVAKILNVVFGQASVSDRTFAGIGLNLADNSGLSHEQLMQLALDYRLGSGASNEEVVELLYTNVMSSPPDTTTRDFFVSWITSGDYTQATLAAFAADYVGIPSAAQNGLEFVQ